jgi:hypothetical protein
MSGSGTKRNCRGAHGISGAEGKPAVPSTSRRQPPLTQSRLRPRARDGCDCGTGAEAFAAMVIGPFRRVRGIRRKRTRGSPIRPSDCLPSEATADRIDSAVDHPTRVMCPVRLQRRWWVDEDLRPPRPLSDHLPKQDEPDGGTSARLANRSSFRFIGRGVRQQAATLCFQPRCRDSLARMPPSAAVAPWCGRVSDGYCRS